VTPLFRANSLLVGLVFWLKRVALWLGGRDPRTALPRFDVPPNLKALLVSGRVEKGSARDVSKFKGCFINVSPPPEWSTLLKFPLK